MTALNKLIPLNHVTAPYFRARIDREEEVLVTAVLKLTAVVQHDDRDGTMKVVRLDRLFPVKPEALIFVLSEAAVSRARGNKLSVKARWGKKAAA